MKKKELLSIKIKKTDHKFRKGICYQCFTDNIVATYNKV